MYETEREKGGGREEGERERELERKVGDLMGQWTVCLPKDGYMWIEKKSGGNTRMSVVETFFVSKEKDRDRVNGRMISFVRESHP